MQQLPTHDPGITLQLLHGSHSLPITNSSAAQMRSPVVKRETLSHTHTLQGDWALFQASTDSLNVDETYLYTNANPSHTVVTAPPQQPIQIMVQGPEARHFQQSLQADTTAPLAAICNSRSGSESTLVPPILRDVRGVPCPSPK
jgi:hypothetical protein